MHSTHTFIHIKLMR